MSMTLVAAVALAITAQAAESPETIALFNGKDLTGWHADVPKADSNPDIAPSFAAENGLLISRGSPGGHLVTDASYSNYRLVVEYRWADKPGNCGILVHASTPRRLYKMFPQSIECQMHVGNAGDFWCIGEDIEVPDMEARRGPKANWGVDEGKGRRIKNLTDGSENEPGEWNQMVIECRGDAVTVWVNDDLVNHGTNCTASSGQIAIQAEGAVAEFRKVELTQLSPVAAPAGGKVKVFVLAGQSNMEGKAPNALYEHQATDDKTKELFAHLRKDDEWIVREDAFIKYLGRHGGLTLGYGSRDRTGVELEFGTVMADHFDEPVLLIKAAWGGHSLVKLFRSPSAGFPADEKLTEELENAQKRVKNNNEKNNRSEPLPTMEGIKAEYGKSYRNMMKEVEDTFASYGEMFPAIAGRELELAGFVWFQGWNDQYGGAELEYAANMGHFIRDVRKDFDAPNLPFIIGVMGQNGSKPAQGAMLAIQEAQLSMETQTEFRGNVKAVRTDELVDKAAETLYPEWRDRFEEWKLTGGDFAYHYLGSAIWFNRIGRTMGEAMLELLAGAN